MAVMSKRVFDIVVKDAACNKLIHPEFKNCSAAWNNIFYNSLKGSFKFSIAVYVIELIIKHKKINKVFLEKQVKNFIRTTLFVCSYCNCMYIGLCLCRYLMGAYYYYFAVFIPGFFGSVSIFFETPFKRSLNTLTFFSMVLETIIMYLSGENLIKRSTSKDTLCFMIYNSIFLHLLKNNPLSKEACILWFFKPKDYAKNEKSLENKCDVTWSKDLLQEGIKYFTAGYSFNMVKYLIKNIGKIIRHPSVLISNLFRKKALKTGLFFSSYVIIYKLMRRALLKIEGKETSNHNLLAGFIAGISYYFDPNLQINVLPLAMTLQILWINIRTKYKIPKWYFKELCFAISCGILFHCLVLAPDYCPKNIETTFYVASNGLSRYMLKNINSIFYSQPTM